VTEKAADDFGGYQTQRGRHGPGEDRGAHAGMFVTVMTVAVAMTVLVAVMDAACGSGDLAGRAVVILFVRVRIHHCNLYSSR
jgi:hypothetical protein